MALSNRSAIFLSGAVISAALALAVTALRGERRAVAPGRCEATWSLSLGSDPSERPAALIASRGSVFAAVARPTPQRVSLRLVQTREGRRRQTEHRAEARSLDAVRGWIVDPPGVLLVVDEGATTRMISPEGGPERAVDRAEVPALQRDRAHDGWSPSGALARDVASLDRGALALWTTRDGEVTTLRYRVLDARGAPAGEPGTLGELLASPGAALSSAIAVAQAGPREAVMALATSHGPRMFHVRCGPPR